MKKLSTRKLVLAGMFACLAFVLNTFVYFPAMAPFQHFVNVVATLTLGPWYGAAAALVCGLMRMMAGRTIQAVAGAVFGPIIGGLLYAKYKNVWVVFAGEVIGTGIVGALVSYPLMSFFYGLEGVSWYYYVPFYTPSAVVGGLMGVAVWATLKNTGILKQIKEERS